MRKVRQVRLRHFSLYILIADSKTDLNDFIETYFLHVIQMQ
jgi:hypothetical protein